MTDDPAAIRRRASAVLGAGRAVRAASTAERVVWLAEGASELRLSAKQAVEELSDATGLSLHMVD